MSYSRIVQRPTMPRPAVWLRPPAVPMMRRHRPGFYSQDGRRALIHPSKQYILRGTMGEVEYYDVYNQMGEYEGLLSKVRKVAKKVTKPVARVVKKATDLPGLKQIKQVGRASAAVTLGVGTAGLLKPKAVGIRSKLGKKIYRYTGTATKVVGAAIAAPYVLPALASGASAVGGAALKGGALVLGGLKKGAKAVGGVLGMGKPVPAVSGAPAEPSPGWPTGGLLSPGDFLPSPDTGMPEPPASSWGGGEGMPPAPSGDGLGFLEGVNPLVLAGGAVLVGWGVSRLAKGRS